MDQLIVAVRAWRGGRDEPVPDLIEQLQERLVGLAAEAAQDGRFVQADGREGIRVQLPIADALVVGQVDAIEVRINLRRCADEARL